MKKTIITLKLIALLGLALPSFAQLKLTEAGVANGFHLVSFVKGFPSTVYGPFGIAVASNGNVIVNSSADSRNYVFKDINGQTLADALSFQPYSGVAVALTTSNGSVYGNNGTGGAFNKLNDNGSIKTAYNVPSLRPELGMWTNPQNGHIFAAGGSLFYDIDVSGTTPTFRTIPAPGLGEIDGITVSPDGTIVYGADGSKIAGYSTSTGARVFGPVSVQGATGPDGTGVISSNNALNGDILVNTNSGQLVLIDPKNSVQTIIATGGTRGDYVAPDTGTGPFAGSLFVTQTAEVFRLDCGAGCGIGSKPSGSVVWANQASVDEVSHHLQARDTGTGAIVHDYILPGDGRGVVVVGNIIYATTADDNKVIKYDATAPDGPGKSLGTAFSVTGATGLSTIAYDGANFYIGDYSGTNKVYYYSPTGTLLKPPITLANCAEFCDGLEYFNLGQGGRLISNREDGCCGSGLGIYDVYDTNGVLIAPALIKTGKGSTGIAFDGTSFFVSNISEKTISVYNTAGVLQRSIDVSAGNSAGAFEDLSFDYSSVIPLTATGPCPALAGMQGSPYVGFTVAVAGGSTPYTYTNILPPGLSFDPVTGKVSGTPTSSGPALPISIAVTDASTSKQSATYSCTIAISPSSTSSNSLTSNPSSLTFTLLTGTTGSQSLSVTSSSNPVSFAFTSTVTTPVGGSWLSVAVGPPGTTNTPANLIVTANAGLPAGTYAGLITITSAGATNSPLTIPVTLNVTAPIPPPLRITSGCPASPIAQGTSVNYTFGVTGGSGNIIFGISIGSLPAGLSINNNGTLFGAPTGPPGTFPFTVQASSGDQSSELSCSLTVTAPALQVTSGCPVNGTLGVVYAPFPLTATGGGGPSSYVFSVGGLPDGLSLNGNSITGTPQKAGQFNVTIQVTSGSLPPSPAKACTITIAPAPLDITGVCPASDQQAGSPVSASFAGAGGAPPYKFSFSGSPFLTQTNGAVSGTPSINDVGPGSFTITVTDAVNQTKAKTCSFNVAAPATPAPTITGTCPAPTQRTQGSTLTIPLTANGQPPFMWSYDNGDPDLALSSATDQNTSLMGTLSKLGPSTFTINLSDATGRSAPALSCSITVVPPPPPALTITSSAPCPATPLDFGSQFTRNFTASGGVPDYRWSVTPASFTLSSATGTTTSLSGTLSTPGPISLTVTLTDSTGATQTFACSLTVNAPPITGSLVVGTLPQDLTQGAPVTLSLTSPSPVALSGRVTLTFTPTSSIPVDNPSVTFSSGSRVFSFNLPAGGGPLVLPAIQRGMVAGTIRVQVTELTAGGVNVLPSSPIFQTITVPSLPPSFTFQINSTGAGFDIVISGFSTTRDITGGMITFNAASGATVEGGTVDLGALGIAKTFSDFYSNMNRSMGESMFKNLTIPVSISGDKSAIGSIAVTLTNSAGSATVTKSP